MRTWVYPSSLHLNPEQEARIKERFDNFSKEWKAHGQSLRSNLKIIDHRFVVIQVDEKQAQATGCSIDDSVKFIEGLESELGISLRHRDATYYKTEGGWDVIPFSKTKEAIQQGIIGPDTLVANTGVSTNEELEEKFALPASQAWTARMMKNKK